VTPPEYLARSQFAAGLDMLFVSDHDSTVNHPALQAIADRRGVPFMPSVEISTSWAHFNAYPLQLGAPLGIDTSRTDIDAVFAEARRLGAQVVQINHPFIPYGYFASLDAGVAPGGWNPAFDLIEINAANIGDDAKVLAKLAAFWNRGDRYYLSAGTDTHDVWNTLTGAVRMFAHVDGRLRGRAEGRSRLRHLRAADLPRPDVRRRPEGEARRAVQPRLRPEGGGRPEVGEPGRQGRGRLNTGPRRRRPRDARGVRGLDPGFDLVCAARGRSGRAPRLQQPDLGRRGDLSGDGALRVQARRRRRVSGKRGNAKSPALPREPRPRSCLNINMTTHG
jgi:hypothetical protein